ncbi:NAD(P)/FAD-dependent oxidoreductase [Aquabacter sp. CN5-332]|uniref:NAD(P)/FAD-dependent oxidoreductase n=1 Tax=Aquabacter sp. CN5-332 TaxID=3156608 RepID=UPI0032B5BB50
MDDQTVAARPRVVIVGGGFGGLEAAKGLRGAAVDVTLLDRQNHHCFQPLLYQVATAALSPADVAWPIRGILGSQANMTILMADVTGVDTRERCVRAGDMEYPYDFLVLVTGATHSYFGHDEWGPVAPGLKRIEDATDIRRRLLLAFERAELSIVEEERQRLMTFVIVGGGPTGVEMAGAVHELARHALPLDFHHIDPRKARIILVEAGERILPSFPAHLSDYVRRTLEGMGVEVRTQARVIECDAEGVDLEDGRISAATIIWAAGVVASPAAEWIGAGSDRAGRVEVAPDLSVPGHPDIFVIGDTARVLQQDKPVPGIAPAAKQMGQYVARVIAGRVAGAPLEEPFRYRHEGDLATIGRRAAVVKLKRLELRGFLGWLFWGAVHVYFLIGTRNRVSVAFAWLWNYLTYQRSARLITQDRPAGPPR